MDAAMTHQFNANGGMPSGAGPQMTVNEGVSTMGGENQDTDRVCCPNDALMMP